MDPNHSWNAGEIPAFAGMTDPLFRFQILFEGKPTASKAGISSTGASTEMECLGDSGFRRNDGYLATISN
jgi:hypothetical protein